MNNPNDQLIAALRKVVADCYALMGQTHLCHWNVRGPSFFSLHTAFEQQYTELFTAIDEIAERIRSLGSLAPGGLGRLAALSGMGEIDEDADATQMVQHLAQSNRSVVESLEVARDAAAAINDSETEDLMISRIQAHQKTIWMLDSFAA